MGDGGWREIRLRFVFRVRERDGIAMREAGGGGRKKRARFEATAVNEDRPHAHKYLMREL
jgi:hypothetical protein